jgi:hypothetical protein
MVVSTLVELEPLRKVECRNWILAPILLPVLPEYTPRIERIISSVPLFAAAKHADKVRTVHGKHITQLQKNGLLLVPLHVAHIHYGCV